MVNFFRWRGRVLRSWRYRRHHRTFANHCSSLPSLPRLLQPVRCPSRSQKKEPSQEGRSGTDGQTHMRFLVDAVSTNHRSRCARSERKQVSRGKRNRRIIGKTSDRAFQRDFSSSRICLCFFFAYTIYARIKKKKKNENVSDNSFCNEPRAHDVLQSLSLSFSFMR